MNFNFRYLNKYKSSFFLILSNLYPIYGVIFLNWDVRSILALFWAETGVIGVYMLLKTLLIWNLHPLGKAKIKYKPKVVFSNFIITSILKLFVIPFFVLHFGGFMLVHGIFLSSFFFTDYTQGADIQSLFQYLNLVSPGIIFLFISHGLSFIFNYIGKKEYRMAGWDNITTNPYKRVAVMHFSLIFGGFAFFLFQRSTIMLVFMILLKIVLDLNAHIRERLIYSSAKDGKITL
ncbi:hypothetical protein JXA34_01815 [Patescibacteria group bacterium]|nr:hypothetical protein [Patescibacteria group bacterium]